MLHFTDAIGNNINLDYKGDIYARDNNDNIIALCEDDPQQYNDWNVFTNDSHMQELICNTWCVMTACMRYKIRNNPNASFVTDKPKPWTNRPALALAN